MKHSLKVVALLAAISFAVQPLASCFSEEMTASEEQCCTEMAGDCGQVSMPTAHSCCRYVDRSDPARPEVKRSLESTTLVAVTSLGPEVLLALSAPVGVAGEAAPESPPGSPTPSLQVLRI